MSAPRFAELMIDCDWVDGTWIVRSAVPTCEARHPDLAKALGAIPALLGIIEEIEEDDHAALKITRHKRQPLHDE